MCAIFYFPVWQSGCPQGVRWPRDQSEQGRCREVTVQQQQKTVPNLELAARLAVPTILMWLEAHFTDGLSWTQVFFILLHAVERRPRCLPSVLQQVNLRGRELGWRLGKWVGYCWR